MKLYFSKGACSRVVRIIIHELGLASEYESVNLKTKVTETGANFLEINPKGSVPVLEVDDKILTENAVILQYLADTQKATWLLPQIGDFNRYRVLEWVNFITSDIHKGFGPLFNDQVPETVKNEVFIPNLVKKFAFANEGLSKNPYLACEEFTLPDAYFFVMLRWAKNKKIDLSKFTNLEPYYEKLSKRKSIMEAIAEEEPTIK